MRCGSRPSLRYLSPEHQQPEKRGGLPNWVNDSVNRTLKVNLITSPGTGAFLPALAGAGAGNVDDGDHCYAFTFASNAEPGTFPAGFLTVTVADHTTDGKVSITGI